MTEDQMCVQHRLDVIEDQLVTVSTVLGWLCLGLAVYLIYRSGLLNLEMLHG